MEQNDKVRLYLLGISYSPVQQGAFAMLLAEEDGPYRIPIVIGAAEAQSIAIKLENIITPRPMTHELFCNFSKIFGIRLIDVFIYNFEEGIFSAEMRFSDGDREVVMDARTSDAVAIAIRCDAPIYTTVDILHQAGAIFEEDITENGDSEVTANAEDTDNAAYASREKLEKMLEQYIDEENYEEAAKIKRLLSEMDE